MHVISKNGDITLLRFDEGEEVTSILSNFCSEQKITGASFTAIGAAQKLTLSFYNLAEKTYEDHEILEDTEILSVTGNVAKMKDEISIHYHGVFAKSDLTTIGGHIKKIIVSATCEVTLFRLGDTLERAFDEKTGLNLLAK